MSQTTGDRLTLPAHCWPQSHITHEAPGAQTLLYLRTGNCEKLFSIAHS